MENFHTYPKIYRIGHDETKALLDVGTLFVEEKIDGGNFRFIVKDGNIIFGTRTQQVTSDTGEDTNLAKGFKRCADFIREKLANLDKKSLEGYIFYGECCIRHSMPYDWEKIPIFLGFDILDIASGMFKSYDRKEAIFKQMGLEMVPLVKTMPASEYVTPTDADVPESKYASPSGTEDTRRAEGLVYKNYDTQVFGKYVRDAFKELNAAAFGGNPKYNKEETNDNSEFIFKYVTNQRIEKEVFKLIDEGNKLEMPLMSLLPKRIYIDVWAEHWQEIRDSNMTLDLKGLRQSIPKRCAAVLNQMITNNLR